MKMTSPNSTNELKYPLMLLLLLVALPFARPAHAEVAVIVNENNNSNFDEIIVEKIYLTQSMSLPGVGEVAPVHQKDGTPIRSEFVLALLNKSPPYIRSFWSKLMFTGGLKAIREVADDEAVIKYVGSTPNAIGYVNAKKAHGAVRIVMTL